MSEHIEHESLVPTAPGPGLVLNGDDLLCTRGVLSYLGLAPRNIMLACGPYRFVVVLEVASPKHIRLITNESGLLTDALEKYDNAVSIRLVFADSKTAPLDIPGKLENLSYYRGRSEYRTAEVRLNEPVPANYVDLLSSITSVQLLAKARLEPRIAFSEKSPTYGVQTDESFIMIGDTKKRCYLRDISPSGAGAVVLLDEPLPKDSKVTLIVKLESQFYPVELQGHILRSSWHIEECKLLDLVIIFEHDMIPISYHAFLDNIIKNSATN